MAREPPENTRSPPLTRRHLSRFALLTIIFAVGSFAATGLTSTAAKASPPCQSKKSNCPPDKTVTTSPTTTATTTTVTTGVTATTATATTVAGTTPAPTPTIVTRFLSDLSWSVAVNGWGPTERDMSNGELGFGDGRTLTLNGAKFPKGLGAHGKSEIRYAVPGGCSRFTASVGVDDEVGTGGSVAFQVFVGTTNLYQSGKMTGASATKLVDLAVSGGTELRLVITDAADGVNFDHGDWAAARFTCTTSSTPTPAQTTVASTTSTATTTTTTPAPSPSGVAAIKAGHRASRWDVREVGTVRQRRRKPPVRRARGWRTPHVRAGRGRKLRRRRLDRPRDHLRRLVRSGDAAGEHRPRLGTGRRECPDPGLRLPGQSGRAIRHRRTEPARPSRKAASVARVHRCRLPGQQQSGSRLRRRHAANQRDQRHRRRRRQPQRPRQLQRNRGGGPLDRAPGHQRRPPSPGSQRQLVRDRDRQQLVGNH